MHDSLGGAAGGAGLPTLHTIPIAFTLNGQPWSGTVPAEEVLLDLLRERAGLTGTKRSCESEVCGACTVLVDGQAISSCNYLAFEAAGCAVTTIEGLAQDGQLDPLQEAFVRNVGAQCGYCTSGQIMAARALLNENPRPTYEDIAHWMTNLCRCGAYPRDRRLDPRSGGGPGAPREPRLNSPTLPLPAAPTRALAASMGKGRLHRVRKFCRFAERRAAC